MIVVSTFLLTSIPKYLGDAIDALNSSPIQKEKALSDAGMMVFCAVAGFGTKLAWRCLIVGSGRSIEYYIRERLFEKLQTLPASFYNENKTGDLITRAIVDIQSVRRLFALALVNTVDITVTIIISIGFMLQSTDLVTTAVVLSPLPVVVGILYFLRKMLRRRFLELQAAIAEISDKVQENTMGIRILKGFAQEKWESQQFEKLSLQKVKAEMRMPAGIRSPWAYYAGDFRFFLLLVSDFGRAHGGLRYFIGGFLCGGEQLHQSDGGSGEQYLPCGGGMADGTGLYYPAESYFLRQIHLG